MYLKRHCGGTDTLDQNSIGVLLLIAVMPFLIQFSANVPSKAAEGCPNSWVPEFTRETWVEF